MPQNIFFGLVASKFNTCRSGHPFSLVVAVPVPAFGLVDLPISLVTGNRERQMQTADAILCMNEHKSRFIQLAFSFSTKPQRSGSGGTFQMCGAYRADSVGIFPGTSNPAPRIFHNPQRHEAVGNSVAAPSHGLLKNSHSALLFAGPSPNQLSAEAWPPCIGE